MTLTLVLTTVVDCTVVVVLAWMLRRHERAKILATAEHHGVLARLRGELADLVADAERRTRALDEALALREATLRVLLQTTVLPRETPHAMPSGDPAEIRLRRDLELVLERPSGPAAGGCG